MSLKGSKTRMAAARTAAQRRAREQLESQCADHDWRYAPASILPGWTPRRTCRGCGKVEWLNK